MVMLPVPFSKSLYDNMAYAESSVTHWRDAIPKYRPRSGAARFFG